MSFRFKIILLGDPHVGKRTLLDRLATPTSTLGLTKSAVGKGRYEVVHVEEKNCKVELHVFHPLGMERIGTLPEEFYRNVAGVLLVYDLKGMWIG